MVVITKDELDILTAGKSEQIPLSLKPGVLNVVREFMGEKQFSTKSQAVNRIVYEWSVMRKQVQALADTEIS